MTSQKLILTMRAVTYRRQPHRTILHLSTSGTGRDPWTIDVLVRMSVDGVSEWLDRRLLRAEKQLAGELLADVVAELRGEVVGDNPLPQLPAGT